MTTIDITAPRLTAPATRLRLTVRGRRVLAVLASMPAAIALVIAILSGGGAIASGEQGAPAGSFETVTVLPGDTLWSIAGEIAPAADPRDVIDGLMSLNMLGSAQIEAGQTLAIPAQYSAQD